jgi:hypothetical protein
MDAEGCSSHGKGLCLLIHEEMDANPFFMMGTQA